MLQQQSVHVRSCAFFFFVFLSYLVLCASDRWPLLPHSYTYTRQQMLTPRVISSLPSVVLTHGITNGSLSPGCLLYISQRHFFSAACLFDTCSYDMMHLHQAFSYGTFLRTENERFQFSKPIVSLMGSKMVHFRVKFFDFHFRDGLHSEMEPHFRSTS